MGTDVASFSTLYSNQSYLIYHASRDDRQSGPNFVIPKGHILLQTQLVNLQIVQIIYCLLKFESEHISATSTTLEATASLSALVTS
jgi:hypothetical protein